MSIDFSKKIVTRDGRSVQIILLKGRSRTYPIAAYIGDDENLSFFTSEGKFWDDSIESPEDLMNIKENVNVGVRYFNVYEGGGLCEHRSRQEADSSSSDGRISCIKVDFGEIEHGRYDA